MTNRVLVLTTAFPPDTNGRASGLQTRLKYLIRNHDWEPIVIVGQEGFERQTVTIENVDIPVYRSNPAKSEEFSDGNEKSIIRQINSLIASHLSPDHYIAYLPSIVQKIKKVINMENIDLLYTMCFPFTFHLIGYITSRSCDVGWLTEFRDPWVTNPNHFDGDAGVLQRYLERRVIEECDQVVYNYGIQVPEDYFKDTYPDHANKVTRLDCPGSCGFDFERLSDSPPKSNQFTIVYGGSFYGNGHSPKNFFDGLDSFLNLFDINESNISVDFYGDWKSSYDSIVTEFGIQSAIQSHGWVDYDELLENLQQAHVALFIVRPFPGDELNVPQKIVDYVVTETPMLVLADSDWEVSRFTQRQKVGIVADPDDSKDISNNIAKLYDDYQKNNLSRYTASNELLLRFDAQTQTTEFAQILNDTT